MALQGKAGSIEAAICVVFASIIFSSIVNAAGSPVDEAALQELISENEDIRWTVDELAFFLATHNFDAAPENGYMAVRLDDATYKMVPYGDRPGLSKAVISN
ncbi:MAG TPA: hypothetical protein VN455_11250 [Methanotrichaceae archaeon]|nr:hypothetical protein [Methanotrichaceae archaeon]